MQLIRHRVGGREPTTAQSNRQPDYFTTDGSRFTPAFSPGFRNLTITRCPIRYGVLSADTTTSTTRSSVDSLPVSDFSFRVPNTRAIRSTLPTDISSLLDSETISASWPTWTTGIALSTISARAMWGLAGSRSNMSDTFRVEAPAPGLA